MRMIANRDDILDATRFLKNQWSDLILESNAPSSVAEKEFIMPLSIYKESHRHYHGLGHLVKMFKDLQKSGIKPISKLAIGFAIFYHDVVYVPGSKENEMQSAIAASKSLNLLRVNKDIIKETVRLIRMTGDHSICVNGLGCIDGHLFLDLDMAILGSNREEYDAYATQIRCEYEHMPQDEYSKGRIKFLNKQLKRKRVFLTDYFHKKYEAIARKNMAREIDTLRKWKSIYYVLSLHNKRNYASMRWLPVFPSVSYAKKYCGKNVSMEWKRKKYQSHFDYYADHVNGRQEYWISWRIDISKCPVIHTK